MTTIGKETPQHGTYSRYIGSETLPACDCQACKGAFKMRMDFRKSVVNPSAKRVVTLKRPARDQSARAEYFKERRKK